MFEGWTGWGERQVPEDSGGDGTDSRVGIGEEREQRGEGGFGSEGSCRPGLPCDLAERPGRVAAGGNGLVGAIDML